jgi:hypothetical protein
MDVPEGLAWPPQGPKGSYVDSRSNQSGGSRDCHRASAENNVIAQGVPQAFCKHVLATRECRRIRLIKENEKTCTEKMPREPEGTGCLSSPPGVSRRGRESVLVFTNRRPNRGGLGLGAETRITITESVRFGGDPEVKEIMARQLSRSHHPYQAGRIAPAEVEAQLRITHAAGHQEVAAVCALRWGRIRMPWSINPRLQHHSMD